MKFGEKLVALRQQKGVSQQAVAEAIGMSRRNYVAYEQGGRYPRSRDVYSSLAEYFGVDPNYLLTEDEEFIVQAASQYGGRGRRQAEQLVAELSGLFAGGELSDEDRDSVMIALQKAYFDCKQDNKKYTPKKYRKDEQSQ